MNTSGGKATRFFVLFITSIWSVNLFAQDPGTEIGSVLSATGDAHIIGENGSSTAAERLSPVTESDVLETGHDGQLHVRFADGGMLAMDCNSALEIRRYRIGGAARSELSLRRGKIRILVGATDSVDYRVETDAGSVKVNLADTDFDVALHSSDGLTAGVYAGSADLISNSAALTLGINGNFDFAELNDTDSPAGLFSMPDALQPGAMCN